MLHCIRLKLQKYILTVVWILRAIFFNFGNAHSTPIPYEKGNETLFMLHSICLQNFCCNYSNSFSKFWKFWGSLLKFNYSRKVTKTLLMLHSIYMQNFRFVITNPFGKILRDVPPLAIRLFVFVILQPYFLKKYLTKTEKIRLKISQTNSKVSKYNKNLFTYVHLRRSNRKKVRQACLKIFIFLIFTKNIEAKSIKQIREM